MIQLLDEGLEELLRTEVPLPRGQVDIAFDTPEREWAAQVTGPTVNLFMWDVRRSGHEARAGKIRTDAAGSQSYRMAPPRVSFRYYITAWSPTDVRDEHEVLGAVLATLLPLRLMPQRYLKGALAEAAPAPDFRVGMSEAKDFLDFWATMEGTLKAGIDLVVTATVDSGMKVAAGAPIGSLAAGLSDTTEPMRRSEAGRVGGRVRDPAAAGAVVRSPHDATVVSDDGGFWILAEPGDEITVDTEPPRTAVVPDDGPVLVEG